MIPPEEESITIEEYEKPLPIQKAYASKEAYARKILHPADCEYVVVGFSAQHAEPIVRVVADAGTMQHMVDFFRKEQHISHIAVFKRMLLMKAKVEWETVEVDA